MSRPLCIGVDARELLGETTGVGRYLAELMRRWTARPDAAARRFTLYSPSPLAMRFPEGTTDARVLGGSRGTWWEQTTLRRAVRRDRPDLFFAPAYTAPLGLGLPLAATIHDISFIAHPEWFRPRERWRRRIVTSRTAAAASVVITDSLFSQREIHTRLHVPPSRIRVVSPGITSSSAGESTTGVAAREPLVLYVGSVFNRRRLPDLIAAFRPVAAQMPAAKLVIVGADRTWPRQDLAAIAAAHGVARQVEVRRYVAEDELEALYARASVFVFLSEYEGFGLTPLEALSHGVPVVVLDTPVAREVYGLAAEYVQAGDLEGTTEAILRGLSGDAGVANQMAQAEGVLRRYAWDRAAEETLDALEGIVR